jgi:hypothetical protein
VDGRASRGPSRAVGGTRQFAGRALVPAGRFRHTPSWPVDAGAFGRRPAGRRGIGGAGRRFRDSQIFFFFCYLGSCGRFFDTQISPVGGGQSDQLTGALGGVGRALGGVFDTCKGFDTPKTDQLRGRRFDTPRLTSSQ